MSNFNDIGSQKKKLKKVKSSIKIQNVFRRVSQGNRSQEEKEQQEDKKLGLLFGRSLQEVAPDGECRLPLPVEVWTSF